MMNPLMQYGNTAQQQNPLFAMFGGFNNFNSQFNNFAANFKNQSQMSPEERIRQLISSGQMSHEQFNQYASMANMIMGSKH